MKWLRKEGGGGSRGKHEAVLYLQTGELIGWVREVGKELDLEGADRRIYSREGSSCRWWL
jgi:hypothetical protein